MPDPHVDDSPAPDLGDQLDIPPTAPPDEEEQPAAEQPLGGTGGVGAGGAG